MSDAAPTAATPPPGTVFTGFLLASAAAIAAVFVFQFGFGLQPCVLCLWQRLPHALAILIAGAGIGQARAIDPLRHPFRPVPWRTFTVLAALLIVDHLANAGIAAFHVGVEQHWWAGTAACTGGAPTGLTADQLSAQLLDTKPARCDEIAWSLFGISMAGYNLLLSLALAGTATWAFVRFNAARLHHPRKAA
jgi:disulfide bond formation protein DsbB